MERVELHQAWMWDCPNCGRENFERAVTAEISPDEARGQAEAMGIPEAAADFMDGNWVMSPEEVTCKFCEAEFPAAGQGDEELEGDT